MSAGLLGVIDKKENPARTGCAKTSRTSAKQSRKGDPHRIGRFQRRIARRGVLTQPAQAGFAGDHTTARRIGKPATRRCRGHSRCRRGTCSPLPRPDEEGRPAWHSRRRRALVRPVDSAALPLPGQGADLHAPGIVGGAPLADFLAPPAAAAADIILAQGAETDAGRGDAPVGIARFRGHRSPLQHRPARAPDGPASRPAARHWHLRPSGRRLRHSRNGSPPNALPATAGAAVPGG